MSRKKNRQQQRNRARDATAREPQKGRRGLNPYSLAFIALIVLGAVIAVVVSALSESPDCPPGQVWSAAHDHCH